MEKEEAVSTVIALMLVLGIVATMVAIYSATYLPGLKQQAEIEHSRDVADAFVRFGSDIDYAVSHMTKARFSEPFALGGGEVLLSQVRSSGTLAVEDQPLVNVTVVGTERATATASLVNISYVPSFTTWEPQGYRWEYGFVAVTKGDLAVPQSSRYDTMAGARNGSQAFLRSFVQVDQSGSDLAVTLVHLFPEEGKAVVTGSGIATLELNATDAGTVVLSGATGIVFDDLAFGRDMPGMGDYLDEICSGVQDTGAAGYSASGATHTLTFVAPATVTLRTVEIEVSAC